MSDPNLQYGWKKSQDQLQNNYYNGNEDCILNTFFNTLDVLVRLYIRQRFPAFSSPRTLCIFHKLFAYPQVLSRYYLVMLTTYKEGPIVEWLTCADTLFRRFLSKEEICATWLRCWLQSSNVFFLSFNINCLCLKHYVHFRKTFPAKFLNKLCQLDDQSKGRTKLKTMTINRNRKLKTMTHASQYLAKLNDVFVVAW